MKHVIFILTLANRYLVLFEKIVLAILLFSMIVLSFGQVVARNIFSTGFIWIDQVLRLDVLWVAFLGAALATEYHQHIKIDFLASLIRSESSKNLIITGANIFAFLICCLLLIVSSRYIYIVSSDMTSTVLVGIPDWLFQLIIPYCFFVASLRIFINMSNMLFRASSH